MAKKIDFILQHLQEEGPISGLEAMERYNLYRLSSTIHSLRRQGHVIITEMIERDNGVRYAQYTLVNSEQV
jgi:hypothetical protein